MIIGLGWDSDMLGGPIEYNLSIDEFALCKFFWHYVAQCNAMWHNTPFHISSQ